MDLHIPWGALKLVVFVQEQSSRREAYRLEGVSSESHDQVQENAPEPEMMKAKVSL